MPTLAAPTPPATLATALAPPVVRARGIAKTINDRAALADISLDVAPGQSIALLGANGAGKSTLLRLFATLIPPTRGTLELFGRPATPRSTDLRARVGIIAHQLMLYRDLTPLENLTLFGTLYRVHRPAQRAEELLDSLGLADRAHDAVRTLSRGMAQRVAIARALVHDPELLLADEPFTGLDPASVNRLEACLRSLNAAGRTVILSHHDVRHAIAVAERAVVIRAGRIVMDAPAARVDPRDALLAMEGPA